jgi:hypothetical protein
MADTTPGDRHTAYTGGAVHSCVGLRLRLKLIAEVEIILSFLLKVKSY